MEIGSRIEEKRRDARLSQTELGAKIGLKHRRVSELERGQGEPTASQIAAIAAATGASVEYLVLGREPMPVTLPADEAMVLEVFRATGLTREEAVRALVQASAARGPTPRGTILAVRDETEHQLRLESERRRDREPNRS